MTNYNNGIYNKPTEGQYSEREEIQKPNKITYAYCILQLKNYECECSINKSMLEYECELQYESESS